MPEPRPIAMPALPLPGGCQCGAVRYRVTGRPLTFYACHCTDCQRQSGSAFGESMLIGLDDLTVEGETAAFTFINAAGNGSERTFCPACGTRLWHLREGGTRYALKAGTLDDPSWLVPVAHIWTASRRPWLSLPGDVPQIPGNPDMAQLMAEWEARLA